MNVIIIIIILTKPDVKKIFFIFIIRCLKQNKTKSNKTFLNDLNCPYSLLFNLIHLVNNFKT